jgi:hypothetical protein
MPRKPKKSQTPQPEMKGYDEFVDEAESAAEEDLAVDEAGQAAPAKLRDWRDVEKYKEERRLRRLIDDDMDFGDLLEGKPGAARRR